VEEGLYNAYRRWAFKLYRLPFARNNNNNNNNATTETAGRLVHGGNGGIAMLEVT